MASFYPHRSQAFGWTFRGPLAASGTSCFMRDRDSDSEMVGIDGVGTVEKEQQTGGQDIPFGDEDVEDGDNVLERITDFVLTIMD